ncbi:hypothetical protein BJF93_13345 [Xaviernesmea oryzae]|uniref:Cellulose synthase n=1 Tax=Xaviernesmea oryzae TaxID=464029 RepID=A0A1Q9AR21_9HYPH|nr:tetratricopeptide repeat protein [Xaviernesmea oryzae]OLP57831.1 hypothetical protein BJF93_13345 [Xaviernesmea oryzae]SEL35012.1 Tetratricopeptide repeat-containing protein [Xaviernesmea oryzae]
MHRSAYFLLSSALFAAIGFNLGHRTAETSGPTALTGQMMPDDALVTGSLQRLAATTALQPAQASRLGQIEVAESAPPPVTLSATDAPAPVILPPVVEPEAPAVPVKNDTDGADAHAANVDPLIDVDMAPAPLVDESALRFFAQQGDTQRLQAEIARLKALYPAWEPPADPLVPRANVDAGLEQMWKLLGTGRVDLVRKAIAMRQEKDASWQPPAKLTELLDLADARERLIAASTDKRYDQVIEEGASHPQLLVCADMDSLWRVAEAFAKTDRTQRAEDAYRYILTQCDKPAERSATVQKAALLLPPATIADLLTLERRDASGKGEFDSVRNDLARQFMSVAAKDATATVPQDYVSRMETLAETEHRASDALLLGWYHERRQKMVQAESWFRKARATEDTAEAAQGLALTLIARKSPAEAEDTLYRWRAESDDAHKTYLAAAANVLALDPPVVLPPEVLARMGREAAEAQDAGLAEQFGWYARTFRQPQLALQWFATALAWKRDSEPAAFGLVLTARELKMPAVVARLQADWAGRSPRIATLGKAAGRTETPAQAAPTGQAVPVALSEMFAPVQASQAAPQSVQAIDVVAPIGAAPVHSQAAAGTPAIAAAQPAAPTAAASAMELAYAQAPVEAAPPRRAAKARSSSAGKRNCTNTVDATTLSPPAALQRGWCLMELNRPAEASRAFDAALKSGDRKTRGDAAYGQSLAFLRLGLTENAAAAATRGQMDQHKAAELQVALLTNRALSAFQAKRYTEALLLLDRRAELAPERADLMVLRGYAYMSMKRYSQAIQIFESVAATGNRDAIKGLAEARAAKNPTPGG